MSSEVNFSSVDFDEFDMYNPPSAFQTTSSGAHFHEAIFYSSGGSLRLNRMISSGRGHSETEERIQKVSRNNNIAPMGTVSGEVGVSYDWGGTDGGGVSGYASGSASDDNGNEVEVVVEVNNDGSGSRCVA